MAGTGAPIRLDEDSLIAHYFAPLAGPSAFRLKDDCALLPRGKGEMVVTLDTLVAGVHFFPDDPADLVARKALRVNLSDLAGKGARPTGYLLSLALESRRAAEVAAAVARGLAVDQAEFGVSLLGGDTVKTPGPMSLSVTAIGTLVGREYPARGGAKEGDRIYVTGTLGDAALGLHLRKNPSVAIGLGITDSQAAALIMRYLLPQPRLGLLDAIGPVSAAMDISDGLGLDLIRLCAAAGVTARVNAPAVPLSQAARAMVKGQPGLMTTVLTGGDDYELLICAGPDRVSDIEAASRKTGIAITEIGRIEAGDGPPVILNRSGNPMDFASPGHRHF